MTIVLLILGLFFVRPAWGYPQFIGYKYASCLTCHYNSQGMGPLNDYGRALWSAEIAARAFAGNQTDEQLAESSGFRGKTPMPWWLRPGAKGRYLVMQTNPGSEGRQIRTIVMQAEANVALHFDKDQRKAFVASYGYVPKPQRYAGQTGGPEVKEWISREHYFRWQARDPLWIYIGMMDKVYGIRHINHTAYSRSRTGLAQNDQTHGITIHYIQPTWELAVMGFGGNMFQESQLRQKGGSGIFEYEVRETWRLGVSGLYSSNDYLENQRFAGHLRAGLGHGSAVMFEFGSIEDIPKNTRGKRGYYLYSEAMQRVIRGYHLFLTGQAYKDNLDSDKPDNLKAGIGLLAFPMARVEFRFELENSWQRTSTTEVQRDNWALLGQLHVSL